MTAAGSELRLDGTGSEPRAPSRGQDGYLAIGEYAVIGDGRTLALVASDGSIDWMCLPELDSPSIFGALLDPPSGGRFELAPAVPFTVSRAYVERSNVLQTTFHTAGGRVRVTDAVTLDDGGPAPWRELVRRVEVLAGEVPMRWCYAPRLGFGEREPEFGRAGDGVVLAHDGLQIGLQSWDAEADDTGRAGEFTGREGDVALLVMTAVTDAPLPMPRRPAVERRLQSTVRAWQSWVSRQSYRGPWQDAVERSLLAIRLLADGRTGAIAAAGTSSLPEVIGGQRNYDYRFGWVRDASFALDALLAVDMDAVAHGSLSWLLDAVRRTHPRVDPVYGLGGDVIRSQSRLPVPGYRATSPAHEGNKAGSQLQLGGFGDLLETIHLYTGHGHVLSPEIGERLADTADLLCAIWRRPDAGLWELSDTAHYGTSKLGCWTALERLLDLVGRGQAPARHVERWERERDAIRQFVEQRLWSDSKRSYLQKADSEGLDCGMLLAARRGFCDPRGERMAGTIQAIQRELGAGGGLLYRYSGMQEQENCFLACSFWMAEALALANRVDEAADWLDRLVGLASDVGLYSEEMTAGADELRGNFPQALTHLSLINAAVAFGRAAG